jgi:hypothetical protein
VSAHDCWRTFSRRGRPCDAYRSRCLVTGWIASAEAAPEKLAIEEAMVLSQQVALGVRPSRSPIVPSVLQASDHAALAAFSGVWHDALEYPRLGAGFPSQPPDDPVASQLELLGAIFVAAETHGGG